MLNCETHRETHWETFPAPVKNFKIQIFKPERGICTGDEVLGKPQQPHLAKRSLSVLVICLLIALRVDVLD